MSILVLTAASRYCHRLASLGVKSAKPKWVSLVEWYFQYLAQIDCFPTFYKLLKHWSLWVYLANCSWVAQNDCSSWLRITASTWSTWLTWMLMTVVLILYVYKCLKVKGKCMICIAHLRVQSHLTRISSLKLSRRAVFRSPHSCCKHSPAQWPNDQPQAAPPR